jgi:hypothetical protein
MKSRVRQESKDRLKKEILAAIGIDSLKKEIAEEVKKESSRIEQVSRNPAVLLILGFILTTFLGAFLTSRYQSAEWDRQQKYHVEQKYLEYKISSIDEVQIGIGEMLAACNNSLKLLQTHPLPEGEDKKILEGWTQSSHKWRVDKYKYSYKLELYFKNPEIIRVFEEISNTRVNMGNVITNLLTDYVANPTEELKNQKDNEVDNELKKVAELKERATYLGRLMIQEVNESKNPS